MIKKILKVCLVGKTNAGKSTFINQVVKIYKEIEDFKRLSRNLNPLI